MACPLKVAVAVATAAIVTKLLSSERNAPKPVIRRVLLFGGRGWIGGQVIDVLKARNIPYVIADSAPGKGLDKAVSDELDLVKPSHVISVVGRTHGGGFNTIDYLEGGPDKLVFNVRDNLYAPMLLARLCEKRKIHYTYYGTGCIFKYEGDHQPDGRGMTEEDLPNFFGSSYSVVKGFTDRLMHHWGDNVLNLRIRMPVTNTDHPRNFITKIAAYERVVNIPNAMTYLPELLHTMVDLMEAGRVGTLNFINPGVISHKDCLDLYDKQVDPTHKTQIFSAEEQLKILKADRSNCKLDSTKLKLWAPKTNDIQSAMQTAIDGLAIDVAKNKAAKANSTQ